VVGMGEQMQLRTRFVAWLLRSLFLFAVIGVGGSVIVYSELQDGQVVLGGGFALAFAALIVYAGRGWYRVHARRRALVAARTWWKDPDVQDRQRRLISQQFEQPFADALPALEQATQQTPSDADAWVRLAETLNGVGRSEEALAASERALALDPQ